MRRFFSPSLLPIWAIFALALALRVTGLTWGLPNAARWYSYHPDERQFVAAVAQLDFFSGRFNPHFFNYPSLDIYLAYLLHTVAAAFGLIAPLPVSPDLRWQIPRELLLWARVCSALLGAATVFPLLGLARRLCGPRAALFAAGLLAVLPGHVQHSHFATVDVPATFFVALSLCFAARAAQEESARWLLASAFAAGLAAATKYNTGLVIVAPLWVGVALLKGGKVSAPLLALLPALALTGFFIGCPFSVFSWAEFWGDRVANGVQYELLVHPRQPSQEFAGTGQFGWWTHFSFNAPFLVTWPVLLCACAGFLWWKRSENRSAAVAALLFCAVYFGTLGLSQVRFMRYLLPLAPLACAFAALGARELSRKLQRAPRLLRLSPAVAVGLVAALGAFNVLWPFVSVDPRGAAAQWLPTQGKQPASQHGKVVALANPPWFWTPPFAPQDQPPGSSEIIDRVNGSNGVALYELPVTNWDARFLTTVRPLSEAQRGRMSRGTIKASRADYALERLQTDGALPVAWACLSEFEWRDKVRLNDAQAQSYFAALRRHYRVTSFKTRVPLELPGRAFVPHDFLYTNPEVRLFKR